MLTEISTYLFEFFLWNVVVIFTRFFNFLNCSSGVAYLLLKDALVFLYNVFDESILSYSWGAYQDEGLSSEGCGVEWMEVLLGVDEDVIWLVEEYTTQEVVEDLSDLWVVLNVFFVALYKLVLPDWKVC